MEQSPVTPINPTIAAIISLQQEVDDLRRAVNKLIAILKANAGGTL